MLLIIVLSALIGYFSTQTLAQPFIDPSFPYQIVPLQWNVPTTPGGPNITVTGTVQDVVSKPTKANPNWKRDFNFEELSKAPAHLEKRGDWPWEPSTNLCAPTRDWGWANSNSIEKGMAYLRGYPGMPELGPGPGACSRVSCSDKAAIYWCNDNPYPIVEPDYAYIAEGAQRIYDKCQRSDGGRWKTMGQIFNHNYFNVIVRYDDTLGC